MDVLAQCGDMLSDERYDFAEDTIEGIRDYILENKFVTKKQKDAIENIRNAVEERDW